ncbi:MAG: hypothetical protein AAF288_00560 [Planctomycetota bacterium]
MSILKTRAWAVCLAWALMFVVCGCGPGPSQVVLPDPPDAVWDRVVEVVNQTPQGAAAGWPGEPLRELSHTLDPGIRRAVLRTEYGSVLFFDSWTATTIQVDALQDQGAVLVVESRRKGLAHCRLLGPPPRNPSAEQAVVLAVLEELAAARSDGSTPAGPRKP